ncbi:MAG: ATP-binding protein [Bacteriovorax sp.]|nr:ATP-binding protein [Bacteriovorax sp.]
MFKRNLIPPNDSFFLFGPRATGKTTWLESHFKDALIINLLLSKNYLSLSKDPSLLRDMVNASKNDWVVIDEIQKVPSLLDEVHQLIHEKNKKFVLTGSSARKLKRNHANLLAGRAFSKHFYTLTSEELNFDFLVEDILTYGNLPQVHNLSKSEDKILYLESYVETYLKEEVQQEALVRNLDSFHRFLEVSAILNGQTLNSSNIARETGVARSSVDNFFSILNETLLGNFLPGNKLKAKVKEVSNPKFYYFDPGIVRVLTNQIRDKIENTERGFLLETWIYNELKAYISYKNIGGEFSYWGTPSNSEVDFIWKRGKSAVGFEVKSSNSWKKDYNQSLTTLLESKKISRAYGIYLGDQSLKNTHIEIFPVKIFLKKLWGGEIF